MATLHVRNVPDQVYEALRSVADGNGRSIGAETIALLTGALFGRRRRPSASLQAFSRAARAAVVDAEAVARKHEHDHVGTDHLLLGVVASGVPLPAGITAEAVEASLGHGTGAPGGSIPFAPETKRALELAMREALRAGCTAIEPQHLVLGIRAAGGPGATILAHLGIDEPALRTMPSGLWPAAADDFRVVELTGSPEEWEQQLNELAAEYELVQIVGSRAVFRRRE